MTTLSKSVRGGDVLLSYESEEYCIRSCYVKAPANVAASVDLEDMAGYPVIIPDIEADEPLTATLCLAATLGSANGIILHGPIIATLVANTSTVAQYSVLVKGPAVVAEDKLPTADVDDGALNMTTFKTQLTAMTVRFKDNSGLSSTQSN